MAAYAIIGFGCAGYHALTAIREADKTGTIHVYSEHPDPLYNPMLTTYYASNRLNYEGMFPFGDLDTIAAENRAVIYANTKVVHVDAGARTITLEDGTVRAYDRILIAAGARSFTPPIPDECPENVISMRTLEDARHLKSLLEEKPLRHAVVIGASMAGIKVAEVLFNNGIPTVVADMAPYIFPLAAYPETAERIEEHLRAEGLVLKFSSGLSAIRRGKMMAACVEFSDGSSIETDLVALCIGTRAASELARDAGITVNRGIVVNDAMETSAPGIYAAGDCCEGCNLQSGQSLIIGLWANAAYQGHTAGSNMAGSPSEFTGNILHNITHFFRMDFIGFGDNRLKGETVTFENREKGLWIQAVLSEHRLAGN